MPLTEAQLEQLSAFADGDLNEDEAEEVQAWLSRDPAAQQALEDLQSTHDALPVSELPHDRIWATIQKELSGTDETKQPPRRQRVVAIALVAGLAAALLISLQWQPASTPTESVAALPALDEAHAAYARAIDQLSAQTLKEQDKLPDAARRELVESIAAVDRALTIAKAAQKTAPKDPMAHESMLALYEEKVRVLNAALSAAALSKDVTP